MERLRGFGWRVIEEVKKKVKKRPRPVKKHPFVDRGGLIDPETGRRMIGDRLPTSKVNKDYRASATQSAQATSQEPPQVKKP